MYGTEFQPVVKLFENIGVYTTEGKWKYFQVAFIEPLPPSEDLIKDFGAIAAGGSVSATDVTELELYENQIGQYRYFPLDDIMITVTQPRAITRYSIKAKKVRVSMLSEVYDPSLRSTELYVFEDDYPQMAIENNGPIAVTQSRVQFFGYRIVGDPLPEKPDKVAFVTASGR